MNTKTKGFIHLYILIYHSESLLFPENEIIIYMHTIHISLQIRGKLNKRARAQIFNPQRAIATAYSPTHMVPTNTHSHTCIFDAVHLTPHSWHILCGLSPRAFALSASTQFPTSNTVCKYLASTH